MERILFDGGMSTRLNDIVPYPTIIKVLLRKIKLQEEEIVRLRNEQNEEYLNGLVQGLSGDEKKAMTNNPMYKRLKLEFNNLRKKYSKKKEDEEKLLNRLVVAEKVVNDYFSH